MGKYKILVLCVFTFLLATAVAWGVFEAVPHLEDEHVNFFQAKVFAAGRIVNPAPEHNNSFYVPFVVTQDGKQFSKYPPGYSLVLAFGMLIHQPWLVNSLAAALGIFATFLLGRDLFNRDTGLLAAALGAISPSFIMLSGTLLAHPVNLAVLTFFAWAFFRARRPDEPRRATFALAAGALMGLSFITRPWTSVAIGLPFAVLALVDLIRYRWAVLPLYLRMTLLFGVVSAILPLYNLAATGSPFANTYTLWWPYDTVGFGPEIGRNGHTLQKAMVNFRVDFPIFNETLLGWPVWLGIPVVWLVIGLGLFLPERTKYDWLLLAPPVALILAHMAYWAHSGGLYGTRYYAEGMPFLWILAARGLLKFGSTVFTRRLVKILLPVSIVWGIVFLTLPRFLEGHRLYDISRQDYKTIAASGIRNALVIVQSQHWTDYANLSWLNPADLDQGEVIFVKDHGPEVNEQVIQAFPGREIYSYSRQHSRPLSRYPLQTGRTLPEAGAGADHIQIPPTGLEEAGQRSWLSELAENFMQLFGFQRPAGR